MAVSAEMGVVASQLDVRAINSLRFCNFLEKVKEKMKDKKVAIFMDNCKVHHSALVKDYMQDLEIRVIYNAPYSPELNPIERVFS